MFGILFKESAHSQEAFSDSLGVIDPVDADCKGDLIALTAFPHSAQQSRLDRLIATFVSLDADRERTNHGGTTAQFNRETIPINSSLDRPVNGIEKIVAILLQMKPDQV